MVAFNLSLLKEKLLDLSMLKYKRQLESQSIMYFHPNNFCFSPIVFTVQSPGTLEGVLVLATVDDFDDEPDKQVSHFPSHSK